MTTTFTDKPSCTHREQQPVRACVRCGAYLRSFGNDAYCDPCSKGETTLNDSEVFELISEMPDVRARRKAFDALVELNERTAA